MPKERRHLAQRSERASLEGVLTRPFDSPAGPFDFALSLRIRQSRTSTRDVRQVYFTHFT